MNSTSVTRQSPTNASDRPIRHLNQIDLSRRWSLSPRTLERWRWLQHGPPYLKVGGRVVYRVEDVEAFEAAQTRLAMPEIGARR
jgi:hypothetical protein